MNILEHDSLIYYALVYFFNDFPSEVVDIAASNMINTSDGDLTHINKITVTTLVPPE